MGERRNAASLFSHSLKTPLSSVKVASQLLLKHLQGKLSEKDQQLLEMVLRNSCTLEARINKLIEYSEITTEQFHTNLSLDQLEIIHSLMGESPIDKTPNASAETTAPAVPVTPPVSQPPKQGKLVVHADPEIADLIPKFLENRGKDIVAIRGALSAEDYDAIRILGHSMKGAGGGYGFQGITDIGKVLEDAAKIKDAQTIRKGIEDLTIYLNSVEVIYDEL
jgi:HPt (histidine-containing phosphotransfer) domain-containing protein